MARGLKAWIAARITRWLTVEASAEQTPLCDFERLSYEPTRTVSSSMLAAAFNDVHFFEIIKYPCPGLKDRALYRDLPWEEEYITVSAANCLAHSLRERGRDGFRGDCRPRLN